MPLKDVDLEVGLKMPDLSQLDDSVKSRFKHLSQITQNFGSGQDYDNDEYLSELLKVLKIKTLVVGVGGAGNNIISRLQQMGVEFTETLNINTDANDLYHSFAKYKLLIGKENCNGLGSGNDPIIGQTAAEEDCNRLRKVLKADIVFLLCGLGGGTGTGAAPIIAREAKRNNSLVVTLCSIPFKSEGSQRRLRAKIGLKQLAACSDTIIPIPNDNLLELIPNIPIISGFKIMDEVLVRSIREIVKLVNHCGLINIDFADIRRIFEKSDKYPSGLIGVTETLGENQDLIRKSKLAIHNPLLKPNPSEISRCIISVSSDHKLSISNIDKIAATITNEIPESAKMKLGTYIESNLDTKIRIMALGKGPISPYVRAAVDSEDNTPFE
jgi:cell division protein FtsZ